MDNWSGIVFKLHEEHKARFSPLMSLHLLVPPTHPPPNPVPHVSLGTWSLLGHMAERVHIAKLLSLHWLGCPMFALRRACVQQRRTLWVRNGTPGCNVLFSAGHGHLKCEIPGAEAGHSARQHQSPKASEFNPTVSSFWGPSLSHPTMIQYIMKMVCVPAYSSLNIIVFTGHEVCSSESSGGQSPHVVTLSALNLELQHWWHQAGLSLGLWVCRQLDLKRSSL